MRTCGECEHGEGPDQSISTGFDEVYCVARIPICVGEAFWTGTRWMEADTDATDCPCFVAKEASDD